MGGLIAVHPQLVKIPTRLGDQDASSGQGSQPVDLPVSVHPHANPGDQLLCEDLTELACLNERGVRVREDRGLGLSAIERQQGLQ
ncbi:hypothetical protein Sgou_21190 [Streptomyces gougerotii]|uniref:Uncharacterized protein n=1 Tax=Streptomyces gougerotii TaxID=53448 RepID=A0ABQ1D4H5_9ACTN|nr:hypothetical protein Sgou_21190 [Streptomyces gougerotii]